MAYKTRRERARGGKAEGQPLNDEKHWNQYNAVGSPEDKAETAKSDGFRRGGMPHKKRKAGGKVEGDHAKHHLGRRARGGMMPHHVDLHLGDHHEHDGHDGHHVEERARGGRTMHKAMARGGSPFSSARHTEAPGNMKDGPGEQVPIIP